MNGPFEVEDWCANVYDANGAIVASGYGEDLEAESKNARMVCAALNAAYYIAKATGSQQ